MAGGVLSYPTEMPEVAQRVVTIAAALDDEVQNLKRNTVALQMVSSGANATSFAEFDNAFRNSGIQNNERIRQAAMAAAKLHEEMTQLDQQMSGRWA